jgi:NifU-like protein involved in Fe-S cluster formation
MSKIPDIAASGNNPSWIYNDTVKDHFLNPRNILFDEKNYQADGVGVVGSPACGDMMIVWIQIDKKSMRIKECKWRTFGCASAIASTSMMSIIATENGGMELSKAKKLTAEAILDRLGGLPDQKYHCSVLGHLALREAIEDFQNKSA